MTTNESCQSKNNLPVTSRFTMRGFDLSNLKMLVLNWLVARHHNGKFIVRLDDFGPTAQKDRNQLLDILTYFNIDADEVLFASQRKNLYTKEIHKLIDDGRAYVSIDYTDVATPPYRGIRRKLPAENHHQVWLEIKSHVLYLLPDSLTFTVKDDRICQHTINTDEISDFILLDKDDQASRVFGNYVDDQIFQVTHLIDDRAYINESGQSQLLHGLDKSQDMFIAHVAGFNAVKEMDIASFIRDGCPPGALIQYIANEGSCMTTSMSIAEIIKSFDFSRYSTLATNYYPDQLRWLASSYISTTHIEELARKSLPYLLTNGIINKPVDVATFIKLNELIKYCCYNKYYRYLSDIINWDFVFRQPVYRNEDVCRYIMSIKLNEFIDMLLRDLQNINYWTIANIKEAINNFCVESKIGFSDVLDGLRVMLSGCIISCAIFDIMQLMGQEICIQRANALKYYMESPDY